MNKSSDKINPWYWISSLYLAEGIPYIVVITVSAILYKRMEISNSELALYTSWLYLPWVIKPLWSPIVDLFKTKRWWITTMQLVIGTGLAGVALSLPGPDFFRYSLVFFWLLAFSSATHDIAADGFYMIGLHPKDQAYFVGIRNTFYRLALIVGQGGAVMLAGQLRKTDARRLCLGNCHRLPVRSLYSVFHLSPVCTPPAHRRPQCCKREKYMAGILGYIRQLFPKRPHRYCTGVYVIVPIGRISITKTGFPLYAR